MTTIPTLNRERMEQLGSALEDFQQVCVQFTGPYLDAQDRLFKLAYGVRKGNEVVREWAADDIEWAKTFIEDMLVNIEHMEYELQQAGERFDELLDEFVQDDEYDEGLGDE